MNDAPKPPEPPTVDDLLKMIIWRLHWPVSPEFDKEYPMKAYRAQCPKIKEAKS